MSRSLPPSLGRFFVLVCLVFAVSFVSRASSAQPSVKTLMVLDIETEDADDQAEALSTALRSRVRSAQAQGWILDERRQALGTLLLANIQGQKCPPKPDGPCLQRIADQLKMDNFLWGQMGKSGTNVSIDLHLWSRGKPDVATRETYSENLKDEESLRRIATRLFAKVTGVVVTGTVFVHAPSGTVWIDGMQSGTIENGAAKVEVAAGTSHKVEVRAAGLVAAPQTATVAAGGEAELTFTLTTAPVEPVVGTKKTVAVKSTVGYVVGGVGVLALAFGAYQGIRFLSLQGDLDDQRSQIPKNIDDICTDLSNQKVYDACQTYKSAKNARTLELVSLGTGAVLVGVGAFLILTDKPSSDSSSAPDKSASKKPSFRVLPYLGANSGGVDFHLKF